jgi:hypothetical protein
MKTMKQPASNFSFKKNNDVFALPDAKPAAVNTPKEIKKGKPGRKPDPEIGARPKQIAGYLTEKEWKKFKVKLDGRPASSVVRNLIINYIDHG